jgi:hypothetical protein
MLFDLYGGTLAVVGTILATAVTYPAWPRMTIRIERNACNDVWVTDIAVTFWPRSSRRSKIPRFEFSIYIVWKSRKGKLLS